MSTTYDVVTDKTTISLKERACFGSLSHCVSRIEQGKIQKIIYYPFYIHNYKGSNLNIQDYSTTKEVAQIWWEYLMSKKFFAEHILNDTKDFLKGIHVSCDIPADRLLMTLFMFRYVQDYSGVTKDFTDLVIYKKIDPDVAFILSFMLNNKYQGEPRKPSGLYKPKTKFLISTLYCPESTLIPTKSLSIKDTQSMLNNLLIEDYDKELFSGKQAKFTTKRTYDRHGGNSKKAICRYFSSRAATLASNNLLKAILIHLKPGILGTNNTTPTNYLGVSSLTLDLKQINQAAEFIQKLKRP